MNNNMKQICRQINKGENLEINLSQYFNRLVTLYEQYAEIKVAMHYYTFYESYYDSKKFHTSETEQLLEEVNQLIHSSILVNFSGSRMENSIQKLDDIRNQIINQMKILTSYTDIFQTYEYVLNRIEYRFKEDLAEINNDEFAADILRYIFNSKDNVIINDRIKEVIGQLPIRFTKPKYYDLVRDSLSIYKGADKTSFDTFIYMLKTGAMLYKPEGMDSTYPELHALRKKLEMVDYANITKEDYNMLSNKIKKGAEIINYFVDFYYGLQEIVNNLYVMILSAPYAYMDGSYRMESVEGELKYFLLPADQEKNICKSIIADINELFLRSESTAISELTEKKLSYTEGKQEALYEEFSALEPILLEIKSNYLNTLDSMMLRPLYECLDMSSKLLGNSIFIDLTKIEDTTKIDENYISKAEDELITQLSHMFEKSPKVLCRAIMANTINKMPVFFQTTNEIMNYVKSSLEQCHDLAEKTAAMNIIKSFWAN